MFVEDFMTPNPVTLLEDVALSAAEAIIHQRRFHQIPVLDESKRLIGIITDRDIRSAVGFDKTVSEKLRVGEVMSADPTTIEAKAPFDDALTLFCQSSFNALPVLRNKGLVGILTRHDMLNAFQSMLGLGVESTRVEAALPNGLADVAHGFEALKSCEGQLLCAVVARLRRDGDEPVLYLRMSGVRRHSIEEQLRRAGLVVLVPEHE